MIAGIMAVHTFPLDVECFLDLLPRVQAVAVWLDQRAAGRRAEFAALIRRHGQHLVASKILDASQPWRHCSGHIWREPLMRALDKWNPSYVLQPDSDERFGPEFEADLLAFEASGRDLLLFDYQMPTSDGAVVPKCPQAQHVKIIRWRPRLSFRPYRGYGRPNGRLSEMHARSKIRHYCFFTAEIQAAKVAGMTPANRRRFSLREPPKCISSA